MHQDRREMFDNTNASPDVPAQIGDPRTPDPGAARLRRLIFWGSAAISIGLITLLVQSLV